MKDKVCTQTLEEIRLDFVGSAHEFGGKLNQKTNKPKNPNMCCDRQLYDADKRGVVVGGETPKIRPERCLTNREKKKKKIKDATETLSDTSVKTLQRLARGCNPS